MKLTKSRLQKIINVNNKQTRKKFKSSIEVLDKKFQKNMALYFKGDEDIVQLIKDNKYEAKDIEKIVSAYNAKN